MDTGTSDKKQVLADPVEACRRYRPDADTALLDELDRLGQQRAALKSQRKALQAQTRKTSRQIGEAKRQNAPIEPLKAAMKETSGQLKEVDRQLADTEAGILGKFDFQSAQAQVTRPTTQPRIKSRRYRSPQAGAASIHLDTQQVDTAAWNRYVDSNPAAFTYHRAEWMALIQRTFGHETYYFHARDEHDAVVGVLPLVRLKSRLFGDFLVSVPFFNYGGALADSVQIEDSLMEAANRKAVELGVTHVEYRDDISRNDMPVRHDKVDMVLDLPDTADALWQRLGSKLRAQIKRARRENPEVIIGASECVDDFYQVFSRNMRDLGTPVYGKSLFANIIRDFADESRIVIVRLDGRAVAGGFLLAHGQRLEIPWASTIRDYNRLSVNMILYWEILKFAIDAGYQRFDFGRSSRDASTYRFKQQWGARPEQLHWHYYLNKAEEIPAITPGNAKYALMINTWKRLPVAVTRWLGPRIVRNIP